MDREKAIRILGCSSNGEHCTTEEWVDAIQLGIEALKALKGNWVDKPDSEGWWWQEKESKVINRDIHGICITRRMSNKPKTAGQGEMPVGVTCHYERDKNGEWWIVWSADFIGDKSGRKKCLDSVSMEIAYEMGKANIRQQVIDEIAHFLHGEISKEKLAENLGMNFYELDELLGHWELFDSRMPALLARYRNDVECSECGSIILITLDQLTEIKCKNSREE